MAGNDLQCGVPFLVPLIQPTTHTMFLFISSQFVSGFLWISPGGKSLPFVSSYRSIIWFSAVIFLQRTFTSLVHAHAGRTQGNERGFWAAAFFALTNRQRNQTGFCGDQPRVSNSCSIDFVISASLRAPNPNLR